MPTTTVITLSKIHVGDVGTPLVITVVDVGNTSAITPTDISAVTTILIYLTKPDGTVLTMTGVFVTDGTDGKIKYVTQAGDIDSAGVWEIEAWVSAISGWSGSTMKARFDVFPSRHG